MKRILTLCLALIGFGFGMQDLSAQTENEKTENTSITKAEELAKTLKLDSKTSKEFLKIMEKHYSYLERNKESNDIEKLRKKITMHTENQMKELLTEEQYIIFIKSKL